MSRKSLILPVRRARRQRHLLFESLERRHMLVADLQNPLFNLDVNDDGFVTPIDALVVINDLNAADDALSNDGSNSAFYVDTSGDDFVTPIDALLVINSLNNVLPVPTIDLNLTTDSGVSSTDSITNDPRIGGIAVTVTSPIVSAKVRVNSELVEVLPIDAGGNFTFDPRGLPDLVEGSTRIGVAVTLADGRTGLRHLQFSYDATRPSFVFPHLKHSDDTGFSDSDNVTKVTNPHLEADAEVGSQLVVRLDGQLIADLISSGSWEMQLAVLADGPHEVIASATDVAGNVSETGIPVVLTIDTVSPPAAELDLAATSDTGIKGDQQTGATRVTLIGNTEGHSIVTLDGMDQTSRAGNDGKFRLSNVALAAGINTLTANVVDLAGNIGPDSQTTLSRIDEAGLTDPVVRWVDTALETIRIDASDPLVATRNLAMMSQAMFDVVNAVDGTPSLVVRLLPSSEISPEAAVSSAAFEILKYAYPAQETALTAVHNSALSEIAEGQSKVDGIAFGQLIAQSIIALRADDGWNEFVDYTPNETAGRWQETSPMYAPALQPQWENVRPFAIASAVALVPSGPPDLSSVTYASDVNEVAALGGATNSSRTSDQTQIARFWADGPGTVTPPGHWNAIASQVAQSVGNSWGENARLFAELNTALGDAGIVAWKAKYIHEFWRPITAIQQADLDGNSQTTADPTWSPLLITPPFPEYVSGHSTFSAAAASVLTYEFGSAVSFTIGSTSLPNVQRSFTSFDQAAAEAGRSRVYGGIHYEFSNQDGQATGRAVADEVLRHFSTVNDILPPAIVFTSPFPELATNTNPTIQGWVLDNLSGVRSLQAAVDGGAFAAVSFDNVGRFTFEPQLELNGSTDGSHVVHFRAIDHAALASDISTFAFTLDTKVPTVVITSLTAGAQIQAGELLAGTADGTGSPITSLSYQVDAGTVMPISFDTDTGSFSQQIDLSKVAPGTHTVTVMARDGAGLTITESVSVQLATAIPFLISSMTPAAGANDVGTTVRPQVFFSRAVQASSLTAANFYATGPDGSKLPATIVPAADGTFAWLFFADPMPGGALITLHVDGATILASADGLALDADGNGVAGGSFESTFRSVSLAPLLGTSLSGKVLDPGPDLSPMTFDDIRAGADQTLHTSDDVFLLPLAGVTVFIVGLESQVAVTDAAGKFHFDAVPAGNVKLAIDGRTATNAPTGIYFPEMVMDLNLRAGVANTSMGTMGTLDQQHANLDREEVYLPRLRTDILQPISTTEPTVITVDPASAPELTPEQRSRLTITVEPGTAIGHDGQPIVGGEIGISTVPPELVRDMLPPGLLQHTFDITIQAPGVDRFTTPVAMTFPNLMGAEPGTQVNFLSFDHATGRLVIEGTMTVSTDGLTVSTDPGMGITHPGWEGTMPIGTCGGSGGPPALSVPFEELEIHEPVVVPLMFQDLSAVDFPGLRWIAPPATTIFAPPLFGCTPAESIQGDTLFVTIEVDGPLTAFTKKKAGSLPLQSQSFAIPAGSLDVRTFDFEPMTYAEMYGASGGFGKLDLDQLYGSAIRVTQLKVNSDGTYKADLFTYYTYRWVDVVDANAALARSGITAAFFKTLVDGPGGVVREKLIDAHLPKQITRFTTAAPFSVVGDGEYGETFSLWKFDPTVNATIHQPVIMKISDPYAGEVTVGAVLATGTPIRPTILSVNLDGPPAPAFNDGFQAEMKRVLLSLKDVHLAGFNQVPGGPGDDDGNGLVNDDGEWGFPGTFDEVRTVYVFDDSPGPLEVTTVGPDKKPGVAGVNDDNDGTTDNGKGEIGSAGSDDLDVWAIPSSNDLLEDDAPNKIRFKSVSPQFAERFDGFMPKDRGAGPDGKAGTRDDEFNPVQLLLMNLRIAVVADELLAEIEKDFAPIKDAIVFQRVDAGADVKMSWRDLGGLFGETHTFDFKLDKLRDLIGTAGRTDPITGNTFNWEIPEAAQQWALAEYINVAHADTGAFAVGLNVGFTNPTTTFAQYVANTVSHELAHTFGLSEGYFSQGQLPPDADPNQGIRPGGGTAKIRPDGNAYPYDIMSAGQRGDADLTFKKPTADLLKAATGMMDNADLPLTDALNLYRNTFNLVNDQRYPGRGHDMNGIREESKNPSTVPEIFVTAGEEIFFGAGDETVAIGSTPADGLGGAFVERSFTLINEGYAPLTLESVAIDNAAFLIVSSNLAGTTLEPGESTTIAIRYDPSAAGEDSGTLTIISNAGFVPDFRLPLTGDGIVNQPLAAFQLNDSNNLGGVQVLSGSSQVTDLAAITNRGAQPLRITAINIVEGAPAFSLLGVPVNLASQPIELATDNSFEFGIRFDPDTTGLRRAIVEVTTNDPTQPKIRFTAVGTGLTGIPYPQWGDDFVAIVTSELPGSPILRAVSDTAGNFSFFLPSVAFYHLAIFDPVTGLIAHGYGTTGGNSTAFSLTDDLVFLASTDPDSDFDGLPDDVEFATGTAPKKLDTDNDGLSDFVEIELGLDPLGGLGAPTGVVAAVSFSGEAHEVVVEGTVADPTALTAYVAAGVEGLSIVDVSVPTAPLLLGSLDLAGVSSDVDVDIERGLAAVAAGFAGLHIVDVANPAAPSLVTTVTLTDTANRVEVLGGLAVVASGNSLVAVDLVTHEVRQTIALGAATLTDLVIEETTIYTMDVGLTLRAVTFEGQTLTPRGAVTMQDAGGKLFVTNGVVYATAVNPAIDGFGGSGYSTVDVSDPDNLVVLGNANTSILQQLGKLAVAANGSGLVVLAGEPEIDLFDTRRNELEVLSGVDLTFTAALRTRIPLPGLPRSLALASGFGFVAAGLADLQVVSIVQLDTAGLPPSATIAAKGTDVDPVAPGVQVLEERSFSVTAEVADDVQVRSVELLVNGQVVHTDLAAPWSLLVTPPLVSAAGSQLTVQVRASDTGGNTSLSNVLSFGVIADAVGPLLVATTPASAARVVTAPVIDLFFDEALDPALLNVPGVSLVNLGADGLLGTADDVSVGISSLSLRDAGRILSIVPAASLGAGVHRLSLDSDILADSAGNHVVVPVDLSFEVAGANPLIAASGSPADPELPSANPFQEISFVMPWGPEAATISFPAIFTDGRRYTERMRPTRTDPATRTAFFVVSDNAVTGDITLFGGHSQEISDLPNWTVIDPGVDVVGQDIMGLSHDDRHPGNGLYLDLGSSNDDSHPLESKTLFDLTPGDYELRFDLAGAFNVLTESVTVSLGDEFIETFSRPEFSPFATFTRTITVTDPATARLVFDHNRNTIFGLYLDNVKLTRVDSGAVLLDDHFDLPVLDGTFPLQIVPIVTGVDVTNVPPEGDSATVILHGTGFIEAENSSYQFGSVVLVDTETNGGPDVVNDTPFGSSLTNANAAQMTLPLSLDAFGAVSVTTAGGRSAPFTVGVSSIAATALSGAPADPAVPSANPGQSITIIGAGLTLATDIVVQYTDESARLRTLLINPHFASLDGASAQVIVPTILNGVVRIKVFGSPNALPVQVVPVLLQDILIFSPSPPSPVTRLVGRGFFEGDSTYDFGGTLVFDADVIFGPDVHSANAAVNLQFVVGESVSVTVITPGGTSAPVLLNVPEPPEIPTATITSIATVAADGVPANSDAGSANTGQVITIQGANFRLDALQILFPTRDESGIDGVQGVAPLAVNESGTMAQVRVPDLAATGPLRVTSVGSRNLGFNPTNDAIHRGITLTFTPASGTAELRFADGGLSGLSDEAWGLDNVQVTRDAAAIFSDDFQGADRPEWSQATTAETPRLSRFSGRFSNSVQTLTLTGLTAGAPHTLRFDLYVLDSWDGLAAGGGPDRFLVRADGETVFDEAFSNDPNRSQTFSGEEGVLLQIVPTITSVTPPNVVAFDYDLGLTILGSGFMEGAGTITIGGLEILDNLGRNEVLDPNVVPGTGNKQYELGPTLFTLDGPVRITTAGGYFETPGPAFRRTLPVALTGIQATAEQGVPLDPSLPSANSGQEIILTGSIASRFQVQFDAVDDNGRVGTITRNSDGSQDRHGRFATITVPESARSGMVRALGSPGEFFLQIVPTLLSVGPLIAGTETVLEGTGLLQGDLSLSVDGQPVASYSVNTVDLHPHRQFVTFTVPSGIGPGVVTVVSSGGTATIRPGVAQATTPLTPAADVGDTIATALAVATVSNGRLTIDSDLEVRVDEDGEDEEDEEDEEDDDEDEEPTSGDIDLYQLNFQAGERIVVDLSATFSSGDPSSGNMRLFNSAGQELNIAYVPEDDLEPSDSQEDRLQFTAPYSGAYFLGVSDEFHNNYNPLTGEQFPRRPPDEGYPTGAYQLHVRRLATDATILTGITATALSGVPALAGVPSAHEDQAIVLTGSGLRIGELIGFSRGGVVEYVVKPLSVSADGTSLTVEVPRGAISGAVRLISDAVGVFLQIVPTLDELNVSRTLVFGERSVKVSGTGFDVPGTIQFGSVGFVVRSQSNENIAVNQAGAPLGPISVTTPGGTSAALAGGPDMVSVVALAASGVPANPSLPSANPGQTITLQGSGFKAFEQFVRPATPIVYQTIDAVGNRRESLVDPTTVDPAGTQMTIIVPADAVTGLIGVVGDPQGTTIVLQIVPLVTSVTAAATGVVKVIGKGLIEGGALYDFGAREVLDGSTSSAGVDVQGANDSANVALPTLGSGSLTVTTAGGTSAPVQFGALMSLLPGPAPSVLPSDDAAIGQLTPGVLQAHIAEAIARFEAVGMTLEQLSIVRTVSWQISDLADNYLGLFINNTILIDRNAAGWGWFIDSSPADDSEFATPGDEGEENRMDLLTAVMHEMGHLLGLHHNDNDLMAETLGTGIRRTEIESNHEALTDLIFGQIE